MACYILVHGAWHASWCWQRITPQLTAQGHQVFAPDLPDHGQNQTSFSGINLDSYIKAITKLINNQTQPVILVGHSMAGIIISQLAENLPARIQALIYIAAFIPKNHESLLEIAKKSRSEGIGAEMMIDSSQNRIDLRPSPRLAELFYNTCSEEDKKLAVNQLQGEPFQPFVDPVSLSSEKFGSIAKTYILCKQDRVLLPLDQKRMARSAKCTIKELDCDHSPFFSATNQLATTLLETL